MSEHTSNGVCICHDCVEQTIKALEDLNAWATALEQRWAKEREHDEDMSDPAYNSHPAAMGAVRS